MRKMRSWGDPTGFNSAGPCELMAWIGQGRQCTGHGFIWKPVAIERVKVRKCVSRCLDMFRMAASCSLWGLLRHGARLERAAGGLSLRPGPCDAHGRDGGHRCGCKVWDPGGLEAVAKVADDWSPPCFLFMPYSRCSNTSANLRRCVFLWRNELPAFHWGA